MKNDANRRLANVKSRSELGLDYVMLQLEIMSPLGRKAMKDNKPFFPGQEDKLRTELDNLDKLIAFIKAYPHLSDKIQEVFMEVKDALNTVLKSEKSTLSIVEIHEVKSLLLQMRQLLKLTKDKEDGDYRSACGCIKEMKHDKASDAVEDIAQKQGINSDKIADEDADIPDVYFLEDTEELLNILDPRKDRLNTFYIYDEFSSTLASYRKEKRDLELSIRRAQKHAREDLRRSEGVCLTPKFDIVVARSNPDLEKIKSLDLLEEIDQDYMSITFKLKATPEVNEYTQKIENLNLQIEAEEERIAEQLSKKIAEYSDIIARNCKVMGKLEFDLAKAVFSIKRKLTKPKIVDEHIVEFVDARNLQVEGILQSKGKEFCPISIELKDGVTCITGANMGGKTISLKLVGQVAILAHYGFFVPAKTAKIGLSNYMHILIGDSQSVERGLSSFGSEMEELKQILDFGTERSMILIDEIASGTNPIEGLALTKSIVDYLIVKPYISLITTHFETVTEKEGVVNMQVRGLSGVDFNLLDREIKYANRRDRINIISKYMDYRLRRVDKIGEVPKDALNIAKMLGISNEIIDGAKKYIK